MRAIKTVIGLFVEGEDAEGAIGELQRKGYNPKDISLIMKDPREAERIQENTGADVGAGAASGMATGAVIGGVAGLLIGIGAIALPGVGAFLIGGPLAATLGLSGAAATTATGAMTGALAGGILGALMELGMPHEEAEHYERQIREGAILLAVPTYEGQEAEVSDAMRKYSASDIKTLHVTTTAALDSDSFDEDTDRSTHHHRTDDLANPVEVQKYLRHVDYPATKNELVHEAEEEGAERKVIHTLEDLPEDKFKNPTDVSRAIGNLR